MITLSNKMTLQDEKPLTNQPVGLTVQIVIDTRSARIKSGGYVADARLPSERALANELGVSRNTVREALDYLAVKNFITRRPGSGSFVTYRSKPEIEFDDWQPRRTDGSFGSSCNAGDFGTRNCTVGRDEHDTNRTGQFVRIGHGTGKDPLRRVRLYAA